MLDHTFAARFANDWIDAWNSHDIERVLGLYSAELRFSSPLIAETLAEPSGKLAGKGAVAAYWTQRLAAVPGLRFALVDVLVGVDSLVIVYEGPRGRAAEVFVFSPDARVGQSMAHYRRSAEPARSAAR